MGQLQDAFFAFQELDLGGGAPGGDVFFDVQVLSAIDGQLRQVGDAQHLVAAPEHLQFLADDAANTPADALVDLIENQGGNVVGLGQHVFERQHQARGLAAGGDLDQRLEAFAGVGGNQEFDAFQAGRGEGDAPAIRQRRTLRVGLVLEIDLETRSGHAQVAQLVFDGKFQFLGGGAAFFGEGLAVLGKLVEQFVLFCFQFAQAFGGVGDFI